MQTDKSLEEGEAEGISEDKKHHEESPKKKCFDSLD